MENRERLLTRSLFGQGVCANDPASALGLARAFPLIIQMQQHRNIQVKKINFIFVNADIHSIFRLISHVSKLNIVTGDDVNGKISVRMTDVPWDQALAAILQAKGLGSQRLEISFVLLLSKRLNQSNNRHWKLKMQRNNWQIFKCSSFR